MLRPGTNGAGPRNDGVENKAAVGAVPSINFARDVVRPLLALTRRDIRTGAMAQKYLLPWNWFRGGFVVNNMVEKFEGAFGKGTLDLLPERPRFVFCGTDMAFGANFVFERERVGSYLAGYADPKGFTLAQAVAASACFPPLFGPMRMEGAPGRFKGGRANQRALSDLRVTDGGVYDNLGLEPVWKDHRVVLVSDAGGLMDADDDGGWFWRVKRYQSIQERQALGVRKRFLISGFCGGTIGGAYIGVASGAYDQSLELRRGLVQTDPTPMHRRDLGLALFKRGGAFMKEGDAAAGGGPGTKTEKYRAAERLLVDAERVFNGLREDGVRDQGGDDLGKTRERLAGIRKVLGQTGGN